MPRLVDRARKLRRNSTDAEKVLWQKLRNNSTGYKFKRQQPVGRYIVDFFCLALKIVIEVDGGQHAVSKTDAARTALLESKGILVIRVWNNDVLSNIEGVMQDICTRLSKRETEIKAR
ncbi:MAG: endonuclease domain-containing protein [Alphaproteobacteria bacterium]